MHFEMRLYNILSLLPLLSQLKPQVKGQLRQGLGLT